MINLIEKLKDCPEGTKLYSPVFGEVEFIKIVEGRYYPIKIKFNQDDDSKITSLTAEGKLLALEQGECVLFPSKDNRDWNKFNLPTNTLKPFDKVLCRLFSSDKWNCDYFSHYNENGLHHYYCIGGHYKYCIPYEGNEHLLNTTNTPKDN